MYAAPHGRIYAGGQDELGYFEAGPNGCLQFHSLEHLIPKKFRSFEDVWDIVPYGNQLYFRTNKVLLRLSDGKIEVVASGLTNFLAVVNDTLYLQKSNGVLYRVLPSGLMPLRTFSEGNDMLITAMLPLGHQGILITTLKHGAFLLKNGSMVPWQPTLAETFKANRIYTACKLKDGRIAVGTTLAGIYLLDSLGRITHHLLRNNGLQNNTVLSLFADHQDNLWAGLDNGISWIHAQSAFSRVFADGPLEGTGYAVAAHNNRLYFGTNTGLYSIPRQQYYPPELKTDFLKVASADGQVWGLSVVDNSLLAGLHEGAFEVIGNAAYRISPLEGVWKFIELEPNLALAGHYSGLALFRKNGQHWTFEGRLKGLEESSRILVKDQQGRIWMSHPYRGVYQLFIHADEKTVDFTFYDEKKGLPSTLNNYVFALAGNAFVATEKGVYRFQESSDGFVPDTVFNELLGPNTWVKYLRQDDLGNIWYSTDHETGVLLVDDLALNKKVIRLPIPELHNKLVGGFEFLYPPDHNNVFIATTVCSLAAGTP